MAHYDKVLTSAPVNKTASLVTNQSGVSDDFILRDREQLKVLGDRKKQFMDLICQIKAEIGIDAREGNGARTKYPRRILLHPQYKVYTGLRQKMTELDKEIYEIRQRLKQAPKDMGTQRYLENFVSKTREKYPEVYEEVKKLIENPPLF